MAGEAVTKVVKRCDEAKESGKLVSATDVHILTMREHVVYEQKQIGRMIQDLSVKIDAHSPSVKHTEEPELPADLSECELVHVPDAVYMLMRHTVLEICNFSANVLRRIPAKIATKFPNLTELYLSNNHLNSLPEELRHLVGLTLLDIGHNQFDILPQVVYRLEALRKLQAEDNNIKEINVARLKAIGSLTEVNLQENPLTDEVHRQLLDVRMINILVTPRDPELDTVD